MRTLRGGWNFPGRFTPSGSRIQQPVRSLSVVVFAGTNRHVDKTRKTRSRSDDRQNGHQLLQVSAQKCLRRGGRCISSCDNADQFRYGSPNVDSKGVTWWIAAIVIPTPRKDRGVKDDLIGRLASGSWARDSVSAVRKFDEGSSIPRDVRSVNTIGARCLLPIAVR